MKIFDLRIAHVFTTTYFLIQIILSLPLLHAFMQNGPLSFVSSPPLFAGRQVFLDPELTENRVTELYAWVSRALVGDDRYGNLMMGMVHVFGIGLDRSLLDEAMAYLPVNDTEPTGYPISLRDRERASLGAMGAAQWTGQWMTRPHALLEVTAFNETADWIRTLPRGCRRTLVKADNQNLTVTAVPIRGGKAAPHSSLAHFRCVVEHEVRLLSYVGVDPNSFFEALSEAVGRYVGTTRMAGEIREYRNKEGCIIAFAHEVTKGRTIRGQWFYATDEASKSYVWFHSVKDLVARAIASDNIDVVDLGPSGSDAFSDLKSKYGFISVEDWPSVADYEGPFLYGRDVSDDEDATISSLQQLLDLLK